jgi:Ca2+-binding EF-hand superfamily protein
MKHPLLITLLSATLFAPLAQAHNPRVDRLVNRFNAVDINKNGAIDRNEACATRHTWCKRFDAIDRNRDGQLTLLEIREYRHARKVR